MLQDNFMSFQRFRYAKWAIALLALCIALYVLDNPPIKPGGGTVLGYGLGTLGALLILFLLLLGVRKRAYASRMGTLRGWLSAHVYLGLALAVVATLHCGFEFGWNIHTFAYALTMAVIISGIWGVVLYLHQPSLMSDRLDGRTLDQIAQDLRDLDDRCRLLAQDRPTLLALVEESSDAQIFSLRRQRLTGRNRHCATARVLARLRVVGDQADANSNEIYTLQFRRLQQLKRIRSYVRQRTLTEIWLLFHVPMSIALLVALTAHIVSVFFYW
jgi:hypothetical protein